MLLHHEKDHRIVKSWKNLYSCTTHTVAPRYFKKGIAFKQ